MAKLWADFSQGILTVFTAAADSVVQAWKDTVNAIANSLLQASAQGGVIGKIASRIIGADVKEIQAENDRLNRGLGIKQDIFGIARGGVRDSTAAMAAPIGTHPYWSLDEIGAGYLQESADVIHSCAIWLREFDSRGKCSTLIEDCLAVAYDKGKSRWYSSIVTRWQYLPEIDEAIAAVKRSAALQHRPGSSTTESVASEDAWFYLRVSYDKSMFNHAPDDIGVVVGDPNYYPLESCTISFFKVRGELLAERLVRLFDRGVKPNVEQEGETRVRVSFCCQRADSFDEDEIFLLEEELACAKAEVERLDRDWEKQTGHQSGHCSASATAALRGRCIGSAALRSSTEMV